MKVKIDKCDSLFSKYIRTRDKWTCQVCHKQYSPGDRGLQCSHFWSRRHKSVRWDGDNACAKCFYCHQHMTANPIEFRDWILKRLGRQKFDLLEAKARQVIRLKKTDKAYIEADLKARIAGL